MRGDILAAADDDVLDPAGQVQIAVFVQQSFITGAKPSIHESASVGFGIVVVSAKNISSLDRNFAPPPSAKVIAILIDDPDPQAGAYSDRTGFAMSRRKRIGGHLMSCLGHAVGFHERHAEDSLDLMNELLGQRRAAGTNEAQRCRLRRLVASTRQ